MVQKTQRSTTLLQEIYGIYRIHNNQKRKFEIAQVSATQSVRLINGYPFAHSEIFLLGERILQYEMEVRGLEPLTSGLQSPRSSKLSYTPLQTGTQESIK